MAEHDVDEAGRIPLLDVVMGRYNALAEHHKEIYSRIFYAVRKGEKSSVKKFHEDIFAACNIVKTELGYYTPFLSGLLFETSEACIHVVEASSKVLMAFLKKLQEYIEMGGNELVNDVKILYYSDDFGKMTFKSRMKENEKEKKEDPYHRRWGHKEITLEKGDDEDEVPKHPDDDKEMGTYYIRAIHETLHRLLMVERMIVEEEKGTNQTEYLLESLGGQHSNLVPRPDTILLLANCDKCLTLKEFFEVFDSPVDVDLENELVWPAPTWDCMYLALKASGQHRPTK